MNDTPELERARRQLEREHKKLAKQSAGDVAEPEPVAENAPAPEPEEAATEDRSSPNSDSNPPGLDELRKQLAERDQKVEELTKRVNAEDGRHGRELQHLRELVANYDQQINDLKAQLDGAKNAPPVKAALPAREEVADLFQGVPSEDLEEYDEKALRLMAQIAKNAASKSLSKKDIAPIEETLRKTSAQAEQDAFSRAVETLAPGFAQANGNPVLGIPPDPEWFAFLSKPVNPDLSEETWAQYASRIGGAKIAATVFNKFQQEKSGGAKTPPPAESRPSLAGQVAPSRVKAATPASGEKVYRRSEFQALERRAARPGGLTDDVRKQLNEYFQAAAAGKLVD